MAGKLNKDKPKSHEEVRKADEEKAKEEAQQKAEEEEKRKREEAYKKAKEEFKEKIEAEMTPYERIYTEVKPLIENLYTRLKKIFEPLEAEWEAGYPAGAKISIREAMKAKAKPERKTKIWERRRASKELDYRFLLLVDMSGSMGAESGYVKINETFKGVVVLTEVLNRLGVPVEVIGFSGEIGVQKYKDLKEKLNKEKRGKMGRILAETGGGTPTDQATQYAWSELKKDLGENNFIITLTDGLPDNAAALIQVLQEIAKEKKINLVGIGLGPGTKFVKNFYPANIFLKNIAPTEEEKAKGAKTFSEVIAKLLEAMIRHPEKFKIKGRQDVEHLIK